MFCLFALFVSSGWWLHSAGCCPSRLRDTFHRGCGHLCQRSHVSSFPQCSRAELHCSCHGLRRLPAPLWGLQTDPKWSCWISLPQPAAASNSSPSTFTEHLVRRITLRDQEPDMCVIPLQHVCIKLNHPPPPLLSGKLKWKMQFSYI